MNYQALYDEQNKMTRRDVIVILLFIVLFVAVMLLLHPEPNGDVDERTKQLCREYAARDHEKEIAPARYQWLGKEFVDNYDWYTSCINQTRYPVAK